MQATMSASSLPIRPSAATPGSTAAMARPDDAQIARQSVFPVNVNTITHVVAANPQGSTDHHRAPPPPPPTTQKRKRRVSDPADAVEIGAQRIRGYPRATATEHPYAPAGPPGVTEHPYAPTDPRITARISSPVSVAVTTQDAKRETPQDTTPDLSTVRYAPFGSIE